MTCEVEGGVVAGVTWEAIVAVWVLVSCIGWVVAVGAIEYRAMYVECIYS